jgi:hypothetical protein
MKPNIFKEIWRTANARKGNAKQGQNNLCVLLKKSITTLSRILVACKFVQ